MSDKSKVKEGNWRYGQDRESLREFDDAKDRMDKMKEKSRSEHEERDHHLDGY